MGGFKNKLMDKNTLRETYLEKRLFLDPREYKRRNLLLIDQLMEFLDFKEIGFIHTFLSMSDKNEVDTFAIIETIRELNPEIIIAVSKTLPKGDLSHYLLNEHTKVLKNNWGIPEPVEGEAARITDIDIVLVPLICFDKQGQRIGYGKGYYDRFLKKVPNAKKIGLALTPPLDIITYADEMDVKLDACISPFKSYSF